MQLNHTAARSARLSAVLRCDMHLSHTLVNRLKVQNAIFVNGRPAHTDYPVAAGDVVSVRIEEAEPDYPAEPGALDILFEDEAVIALDKPSGLLMHPSHSRNTGTLANYLAHYYRESGQKCAVHPVSRLDRDTFGVVLLAKNAHIHAKLCQLMKDGAIHKTYLAAVFGCPEQPAGEIALPVYKLGNGSLLRMVDPRGKRAVSRYRVISSDHQTSVLALNPVTGRTHQLRLHCKAAGFPILGDPQYCSPASALYSGTHGLFCQQLLAARLELTHPVMGQPLVISSRQSVSAGDEQVHADARVLDGNVRAV